MTTLEFLEEYLPNYSSRDDVARLNDLYVINDDLADHEGEDSCAMNLFKLEYMSVPDWPERIKLDIAILERDLLAEAIEACPLFLKNLPFTFDQVFDVANDVFWKRVKQCYPLCKTGALSPDTTRAFEAAAYQAIREWVSMNGEGIYKWRGL